MIRANRNVAGSVERRRRGKIRAAQLMPLSMKQNLPHPCTMRTLARLIFMSRQLPLYPGLILAQCIYVFHSPSSIATS